MLITLTSTFARAPRGLMRTLSPHYRGHSDGGQGGGGGGPGPDWSKYMADITSLVRLQQDMYLIGPHSSFRTRTVGTPVQIVHVRASLVKIQLPQRHVLHPSFSCILPIVDRSHASTVDDYAYVAN
jgi:hypothetical protein